MRKSRCLVFVGVLLACAFVSAHEIGTTQVGVVLGSESYEIEVIVDPDALVQRLEVLAGEWPARFRSVEADTKRIEELQQIFLANIVVSFDGTRVSPQFAYTPQRSAQGGTVRLTGAIPGDAGTFQWSSALIFGSYALTLRRSTDPAPTTVWLTGGETSTPFDVIGTTVTFSTLDVISQYVHLGFTHILPKGLDHILFVVGLFLLSTRWRPLLAQITTFTVAHSITLGLSIYGLVSLSPRIVEPLIALSIAYVAVENIAIASLTPWRVGLVFVFGLLHGLGFAGVLQDLGLPRSQFLTALFGFNAGVELGQLAVVSLAFVAVFSWQARGDLYRRRIVIPASAVIAIIGVYWTIERLVA